MGRIHQLRFDAIQSVSVVKLVYRLADLHISKVCFPENLCLHSMMLHSPHSNFHFVVRVVSTGIKNVYISSLNICAYVSFPKL